VAYGAFRAFVDAEALGHAIVPEEARAGRAGRADPPRGWPKPPEIAQPVEPALGVLSFVVLTAPPCASGDARNATVGGTRPPRSLGDRDGDLGASGRLAARGQIETAPSS
jgi:hypothetical protein